jgi:PAS domain S-box-containing protein
MPVNERGVEAEIERVSGKQVNETRLRLALDAARMGTWERNLATGEDIWSSRQEALFGLEPGSFATSHQAFLSMVHPDDRPALNEAVRRSMEESVPYRSEYRIILPDGSMRWMAGTGDVIRDADGTPTHMVGVTRDITERKRVEEERATLLAAEQAARQAAEVADRAKDAFLATVSHELRTPLTAILGWAQLLRHGQCDPEEAERGLATIERNARSMSQLVDDVLDVSRIITGKLRLNVQPLDLSSVIDAAFDAVRPMARSRNIELQIRLASTPLLLEGDAVRLQQVVWNLLVNAVKFTPEGGQVHLETCATEAGVRIVVSDTGDGIAPDFLPHLFERFTQADTSSRRPHSGLGLGLAIVRQLVELHGGAIHATSPGLGQGATFTVELPLNNNWSAAPADNDRPLYREIQGPPHAQPQALEGIEVLVVDDEPDTRDFIRKVLADSGAKVRAAGSTAEALDQLNDWQPRVLLSDIAMPGADGYDLIRKVRSRERTRACHPIAAAALTAFAHPEDRAKAIQAGFHIHVAKPVDPTELVAIVAKLAASQAVCA